VSLKYLYKFVCLFYVFFSCILMHDTSLDNASDQIWFTANSAPYASSTYLRVFPFIPCTHLSSTPYLLTSSTHLILLDSTQWYLVRSVTLRSSSLYSFLQHPVTFFLLGPKIFFILLFLSTLSVWFIERIVVSYIIVFSVILCCCFASHQFSFS
jgi:hypothetical protein